jgi:hypothetical protein
MKERHRLGIYGRANASGVAHFQPPRNATSLQKLQGDA